MNAKFLISIIAGALFTLSAHAHDCSGGANGGMDATGNECTRDASAVATDGSSGIPTSPSARSPKAQTNKAASGNKSTAKRTVGTRHNLARAQVKHSS
jgi:hypothetical protein